MFPHNINWTSHKAFSLSSCCTVCGNSFFCQFWHFFTTSFPHSQGFGSIFMLTACAESLFLLSVSCRSSCCVTQPPAAITAPLRYSEDAFPHFKSDCTKRGNFCSAGNTPAVYWLSVSAKNTQDHICCHLSNFNHPKPPSLRRKINVFMSKAAKNKET